MSKKYKYGEKSFPNGYNPIVALFCYRPISQKIASLIKNVKFISVNGEKINLLSFNLERQIFLYDDLQLDLPLLGKFQKENLQVVLGIIEELREKSILIKDEAIVNGLKKVSWPGRMEVIQQNPLVILDCAHNPAAIKNLVESLNKYILKKIFLILGISYKKDYQQMIKLISPICKKIIFTKAKFNGENPYLLSEKFLEINKVINDIKVIEKVVEATNYILDHSKKSDVILITGSIFVVGEARKVWF